MRSNKFVIVLLIFIKINQIKSQDEVLSCDYQGSENSYNCQLTIINPNGLNNFQDIRGAHIAGMSDSDVTYVGFASGSNTTNIPSIICGKFQNLQAIYYGTADITEINDYYYSNCKNFQTLFFYGNSIKKVYKNAFIENIKLLLLVISMTEITDLPANVFPKLGNELAILDLSSNKLKIVKAGWFQSLTNLESVNLAYNLIEEVPINAFINCKNLKYLNMDNNKLKIVQSEWFQTLINLETVTFSLNLIEEIQINAFINCKNLTYINMENNKLKVLSSKSFYDISKLETYNFYENQLFAIDEKFINNSLYNKYLFIDNWCILTRPNKVITIDNYIVCIENYRAWENGCTLGNTNERICKLENDNQQLIDSTKVELNGIQGKIDVLTKENQDLTKENQDLKSKVDILIEAVQSIQNQINVLNAHL